MSSVAWKVVVQVLARVAPYLIAGVGGYLAANFPMVSEALCRGV